MRFARLASLFAIGAAGLSASILACSADPKAKDPLPLQDDDNTPDPNKDKPKTSDGTPTPVPDDTTLPEAAPGTGRMYAHTAKTLYLFEPIKHTLTKVGDFSCLGTSDDMLDIALDRTEQMWGTTRQHFVKIDPLSGTCDFRDNPLNTAANVYPNSLSFVPAGTVDATKEVLVGYVFDSNSMATKYVKIDSNGVVSPVGDLNTLAEPTKWAASGDMISLINAGNKSYLTVKLQTPPEAGVENDSLAEVDPTTGRIKSIIGKISTQQTYGLGYWAGKGYGFAGNGYVIEIDMTTGNSTLVQTLVDSSNGAALPFYGAGVGTSVPIK